MDNKERCEMEVVRTILMGLENWEDVGRILFWGTNEEDALSAVAEMLGVSSIGVSAILDQPIRNLLPERRLRLVRRLEELGAGPS